MNEQELHDLGIEVESYIIKGTRIRVAWRAPGLWAINHGSGSGVWNGENFEYEPLPSRRTDEFKARTRFDLDTALRLAVELAAKG